LRQIRFAFRAPQLGQAVRHLCNELNATETLFPGTDLKLVYELGSS
jgi:hypothetical protein